MGVASLPGGLGLVEEGMVMVGKGDTWEGDWGEVTALEAGRGEGIVMVGCGDGVRG